MVKTNIKSLRVEQDGPLRFERVQPWSWELQRRKWFNEFQQALPFADELPKFGDPGELNLLAAAVLTITVVNSDSQWMQWRFTRGFLTDLASVPKYFRSVVDNDDIRLMLAALVHDYNFTTHALTFEQTNKLFLHMALLYGCPRWRAWLAWLAVSSPVGRKRWRENRKRNPWTDQTAQFMSGR